MILPDCPEIREFVPQDDWAIFYDYHDRDGLLKAMKEGINPSRRHLIQGNLERITYNPSWGKVAKIVVEGYRGILKGNQNN